jgi:hypothetical protein
VTNTMCNAKQIKCQYATRIGRSIFEANKLCFTRVLMRGLFTTDAMASVRRRQKLPVKETSAGLLQSARCSVSRMPS